jgi:hypothetical protein
MMKEIEEDRKKELTERKSLKDIIKEVLGLA